MLPTQDSLDNMVVASQQFRHADTNWATRRTSAWIIESPRRRVLLQLLITLVVNLELIWGPVHTMPIVSTWGL
eukprot:1162007-Pelagomonas_calceolata.AAC.1